MAFSNMLLELLILILIAALPAVKCTESKMMHWIKDDAKRHRLDNDFSAPLIPCTTYCVTVWITFLMCRTESESRALIPFMTHTQCRKSASGAPSMPHSPVSNQLQFTASTKRWCSATPVHFLAVLKRLSWTQQEEVNVGPIKRNYTKRGKGTFIYKKKFVNWELSAIANHCPNRQGWDLEEKSQDRLEEPLHPTLPACRIPMKNNNTQAAYQSILSFPHISTDRSANSKPDRCERS